MVYINRERPHDADTKRRQYADTRAQKLNGLRNQFIHWCQLNGKTEEEKMQGLADIERLVDTWRDVADQNAID